MSSDKKTISSNQPLNQVFLTTQSPPKSGALQLPESTIFRGGAKRHVPHFDDLLFLRASMSRYP